MGQPADGTPRALAVGGRQAGWPVGVSMVQVRELLLRLGAVDAIAPDGGSSAGVHVKGRRANGIVNRP